MSGGKYKDCEAHNLKVVGSNPAPATNQTKASAVIQIILIFLGDTFQIKDNQLFRLFLWLFLKIK